MAFEQNNNRRGPYVKTDRFQNPYQLKVAEAVLDKKSGQVLPIFKTYVELAGKLYKIEISECKKETKHGRGGMWCKVTLVNKNRQQTSM